MDWHSRADVETGIPRPALVGPPDWPLDEYAGALRHSGLRTSTYRRWLAEKSPLIFGLIYFADSWLRMPMGNVELNDLHCDVARVGNRLRHPTPSKGHRYAVVGPRGGAKSTWMDIVTLWTLIFGHRRFAIVFGMSASIVCSSNFDRIRSELASNPWLQRDYPQFCLPAAGPGNDRAGTFVSRTGAILAARGVTQAFQGLNIRSERPDLVVLDDIQGDGGDYTEAQKEKRLRTIQQGILGMDGATRAAVFYLGTTVAYGCLTHDLLRHSLGEMESEWAAELGFETAYYPAIIDDPGEEMRSLWPGVWPLEELLAQRGEVVFELTKMNRPIAAGGTTWQPRHFIYGIPTSWVWDELLCWVDPAVTNNNGSDYTGIAVAGRSQLQTVGVLESLNVKVSPEEFRETMRSVLYRFYPLGLRAIKVENNQGGMYVAAQLAGLELEFPGIHITQPHTEQGKAYHFGLCFGHYEKQRVRHARVFRVAEDQLMRSNQKQRNDDAADSVARCVNELLSHLPALARR
jgi:hypothetical protein